MQLLRDSGALVVVRHAHAGEHRRCPVSRAHAAGPRDRAVILDAMVRGQVVLDDCGRTWRYNEWGRATVGKVPVAAATMDALVRDGLAVLDGWTWRRRVGVLSDYGNRIEVRTPSPDPSVPLGGRLIAHVNAAVGDGWRGTVVGGIEARLPSKGEALLWLASWVEASGYRMPDGAS